MHTKHQILFHEYPFKGNIYYLVILWYMLKHIILQKGKNNLLGYPFCNYMVYFGSAACQFFVKFTALISSLYSVFLVFWYHSFGTGPRYIILWFGIYY